jgi:spore coat protein CotH
MSLRTAVLAVAACACLAPRPAVAQDPIYDQSRLHETRLVLDPGDWSALRQNFRTNQYYAANISIDGEVVQQVGIRSRGKGSRSGEKPGLKVDMNRYVSGQEFHGRKSVILDNVTQDPSFLREPLSYAVFEAMGIAAPQIAHTRLTVNDEYWGVYTLVEDVSKPFLEARLGDKEGNLFSYEYSGVYDFSFRGASSSAYVPVPFEPETNETSLDPSGLVAFIRTVNEAPDAGFVAAVTPFLDVTRFLTHVAVENAIAENDGILGFEGMNNFYLYQYAGQNRFVFIPWDKDTTFVSADFPLLQRVDTNVLVRRLLADPAQMAVYQEAVKRAGSLAVIPAFLNPRLESMYALIRNSVLEDRKKPNTNEEFELAVEGLKGLIAARAQSIAAQADGIARLQAKRRR